MKNKYTLIQFTSIKSMVQYELYLNYNTNYFEIYSLLTGILKYSGYNNSIPNIIDNFYNIN